MNPHFCLGHILLEMTSHPDRPRSYCKLIFGGVCLLPPCGHVSRSLIKISLSLFLLLGMHFWMNRGLLYFTLYVAGTWYSHRYGVRCGPPSFRSLSCTQPAVWGLDECMGDHSDQHGRISAPETGTTSKGLHTLWHKGTKMSFFLFILCIIIYKYIFVEFCWCHWGHVTT